MPNKYLREEEALIGFGSIVLKYLRFERLLSELWDEIKNNESIVDFERFILVLDMLYILGLVEFKENKIRRVAV